MSLSPVRGLLLCCQEVVCQPNAKAFCRGTTAMAKKKNWVRKVKTVSTYPPRDLFTKDAQTIARGMASKKVSPKGLGSGIRMIQYFINRGGKNLPAARKKELEKAKKILQERLQRKK
jgi:tRNA(adenine34) deaminase